MHVRAQCTKAGQRFVVDYREPDGQRHQRFFKAESAAYDFAAQVSGEPDMPIIRAFLSIGQLLAEYQQATAAARNDTSRQTLAAHCAQVAKVAAQIEAPPLSQFTAAHFTRILDTLRARSLSTQTVYTYMRTLRSAIKWAIARGWIPAQQVGKMTLPHLQRQRNEEEIQRWRREHWPDIKKRTQART